MQGQVFRVVADVDGEAGGGGRGQRWEVRGARD